MIVLRATQHKGELVHLLLEVTYELQPTARQQFSTLFTPLEEMNCINRSHDRHCTLPIGIDSILKALNVLFA